MFDDKGFDSWADDYDKDVGQTDKDNRFPFAGYERVIDGICGIILEKGRSDVLDVGFGTGKLASRLYENGCRIYGQDYSQRMIELAKEKMPEATLYKQDFSKGLAEPLLAQKYDFIVSTYAMHHLDEKGQIKLLDEFLEYLKEDGKILIGDIAFETEEKLKQCKTTVGDEWDDEESYFVFERFKELYTSMTYTQISFCGAILSLNKNNDNH